MNTLYLQFFLTITYLGFSRYRYSQKRVLCVATLLEAREILLTMRALNWMLLKPLKELRNLIFRIILVWSLFCLIRICVGLHFLQFLLENFSFLSVFSVLFVLNQMLWIKALKYVLSWDPAMKFCYVILLCNFFLTLQKLFIKNFVV